MKAEMTEMTEKITVKHVAKSPICETCAGLEKTKRKVEKEGHSYGCECISSQAYVWPVKE